MILKKYSRIHIKYLRRRGVVALGAPEGCVRFHGSKYVSAYCQNFFLLHVDGRVLPAILISICMC